MAQITVTFDRPENPPAVCDALNSYLEEVAEWIELAELEKRDDDVEVNRDLYALIERLVGNLAGI